MKHIIVLLAALVVHSTSTPVFAQDSRCPADVNEGALNCTSQDVTLASIDYDPAALPGSCIAGSLINIPVSLGFTINANANRDDVAVWIAQTEGDIQQPSATTGPQSCALLVLPGDIDSDITPGLQVVGDTDGDVCYDVLPGSQGETFSSDFGESIEVICLPDINGQLTFQTMVTWDLRNSGAACDGTPSGFEGTLNNSKCKTGDPIVLPIEVQTSLTIEKQTLPDGSAGTFDFSGTAGGSAFPPFSLSDDGSSEILGSLGDQFLVSESAPAGWTVDSILCTNDQTGEPAVASVDTGTGELDITLDSNQFDVTCVYTNLKPTTLTVIKNTVGGDDDFSFSWSSTGNGTVPFTVTTVGGTNDPATVFNLTTGLGDTDYAVTEVLTPDWEFDSAGCIDQNAIEVGTPGSQTVTGITINAGDDITCTFNNRATGTIVINKTTIGGDSTFAFTASPDLGVLGGAFNIVTTANNGSTGSVVNLSPGTYIVTETGATTNPDRWSLTGLTCDDPDGESSTDGATATIDLDAGETVTCSYENTELGSITVVKTTEGGDGTFSFTSSTLGAFDITTSGNTSVPDGNAVFPNLTAGLYDVAETVPTGWDLDNASCSDGSDPASIDLAAGENVICTFNNVQRGTINVVKQITATGPESGTFDFTGTGPDGFDFGGGFSLTPTAAGPDGAASTSPDFSNLVPGSYSITEGDNPEWLLAGVTCSGETGTTNPAAITLDPGEIVTCTFTNAPLGSTTIVKSSIGGEGLFGFTWGTNVPEGATQAFNLDTTDGEPVSAGTASADFTLLPDTAYDLSETSVPADVGPYAKSWQLTNVSCEGAGTQVPGANGADATITGTGEGSAVCTFENTLEGTLVIRKETSPDGVDQVFEFTGDDTLTGALRDYSAFAEELVLTAQPGTFGTTESVPEGWAITQISCSGATNSSVSIGTGDDFTSPGWDEGDDQVSVDLSAGETVICTYENALQASITIVKNVVGEDAAFEFLSTYEPDGFTLSDGQSYDSGPLASGTYSITEMEMDGYALTGIVCEGATDSTITEAVNGVQIELTSGEAVICTFTNTQTATQATFEVYKIFTDENVMPVTINLQCNDGIQSAKQFTLSPPAEPSSGDFTARFIVTDFLPGEMDCTIWEEEVPGYEPSYECSAISATTLCDTGESSTRDDFGTGPCVYTDVDSSTAQSADHTCTIRNYPAGISASVTKEWVYPNMNGQDVVQEIDITLWCTSEIVGGLPVEGTTNWSRTFPGVMGNATVSAEVYPEFPSTFCWATEEVFDNAIEATSDCGDASSPGMILSAGNSDSCTLTNTVFFEGIPTMSRMGMALMVLLMMGGGLMAFRRFS